MSIPSIRLRLGDYLEHVFDACETILAYKTYAEDLKHASSLEKQLIQDATIRNFEIIGEALRNIERHYPDYLQEHPELPLDDAYGMRNHLAHGYFSINMEIVTNAVKNDIPALADIVRKLMQEVQTQTEQTDKCRSE